MYLVLICVFFILAALAVWLDSTWVINWNHYCRLFTPGFHFYPMSSIICMMSRVSSFYPVLHSIHVSLSTLLCIYSTLYLACPHLHVTSCPTAVGSVPRQISFLPPPPPASLCPSLDGLYSNLLASLYSKRCYVLPPNHPSQLRKQLPALFLFNSLLLYGDM